MKVILNFVSKQINEPITAFLPSGSAHAQNAVVAAAASSGADNPPTGVNDEAEPKDTPVQPCDDQDCTRAFTNFQAGTQSDKPREKRSQHNRFVEAVDGVLPAVALKKFKQVMEESGEDPDFTIGIMTGSLWTIKKERRMVMQKLVIGVWEPSFWEGAAKHFSGAETVKTLLLPDSLHILVEDEAYLQKEFWHRWGNSGAN